MWTNSKKDRGRPSRPGEGHRYAYLFKKSGKQGAASSPPGLVHSSFLEALPSKPWAQPIRLGSHLHPVHGLPELVELVGGAEGFQADVCQLHLLVSQLIPELHDCLGLTVHAL